MKIFDWFRRGKHTPELSSKSPNIDGVKNPNNEHISYGNTENTAEPHIEKIEDFIDREQDGDRFYAVISEIQLLAEQGDSRAKMLLGLALAFGAGIKKSPVLAERWLTSACVDRSPTAHFILGLLKYQGGFLEKGHRQALYWLNSARRLGVRDVSEIISCIDRSIPDDISIQSVKSRRPKVVYLPPNHKKEIRKSIKVAPSEKNTREKLNIYSAVRGTAVGPETYYVDDERKSYDLGYRQGRRCLKAARRFNKIMSAVIDGYIPQQHNFIGKRFAMRRGFLQQTVTEGMELLTDRDKIVTPSMRDAFIKGVVQALNDSKPHG